MGFLRRALFGDGRLSENLRSQLTGEDVLLLVEELSGTLTYRDYEAPNRRASLEKFAVTGGVAVTGRRLVAWTGRGENVNVPLDDARVRDMDIGVEPGKIRIAYDPSAFNPQITGRVELRFHTGKAAEIVALVSR